CDPTSSTFVDCGTVTLTMPHAGRVPVIANAQFDGANSASGYRGDCEITVDNAQLGASVAAGSSDGFGVGFNANQQGGIGMNGVTGSLGAGPHSVSLKCNQAGGSVEFPETYVSALGISAGW